MTLMRAFSALSPGRLCIGAGSNVVDLFFPVRKLPSPGDKQYFAHEQLISSEVVGGVTLNHLSWARALGVPTALLALQGLDANGEKVRSKMASLGVGTGLIDAREHYTTSVSYILSEEGGERTILMNPASTSRMTGALMAAQWAPAIAQAGMVTTEISQLPLSGVEWLLRSARAGGAPSVLDVDVPPSVATGSARLGTAEELQRCVRGADVVKLTGGAVEELLHLLAPGVPVEPSLEGVTQQLADVLGCRLAVITDGSRGSALAVSRAAGGGGVAVRVPCFAGVTQVDATGAGDAYLGGLIAALWHCSLAPAPASAALPTTDAQLMHAGRIASAAGAACVEVVGALPAGSVSAARLAALCPEVAPLLAAARELHTGASTSSSGSGSSGSASASAPAPAAAAKPLYSAFLASLEADAAALAALEPPCTAAVEAAVAALALCRGQAGGAAEHHSSSSTASMCWTTGMGKAGAVAARAAMSLKSLGYRSAHTPAAEWAHGDLGALAPGDVVLAFSHSGRTPEVLGSLQACKQRGARIIAVTGSRASPLALAADVVLEAAAPEELLGAVPTRSVVAQEAVVNALLSACVTDKGITARHFKANHPGGAIGGKAQ